MKQTFYARYNFSLKSYCFRYNQTEVTLCLQLTVCGYAKSPDVLP